MPPLDFHSVLALGAAISALLTVVCLLLAPMLGGATRLLAIGNLCFTLMLCARMLADRPPSQAAYAVIWSLLIASSALHGFALRELGSMRGTRIAGYWTVVGTSILLLWATCVATALPQVPALLAAVATTGLYGAALHASMTLGGRVPAARRTLVLAFGFATVFAALHVLQRTVELARGDAGMAPTAFTYFGAVLLFCMINAGFLVLLYQQLAQRVVDLAQTDELTGVLNRRGFFERVERMRAAAPVPAAALMMLDIDRFKSVNDTLGHAVGDEVLRGFARTVSDCMRPGDLLARMGGEEFCLLLPGLDEEAAREFAEHIRRTLEGRTVAQTPAGPLSVTASFGIAAFGPDDGGLDLRLRQADEALYAAKRDGRNRVVLWSRGLGSAIAV